MGYAFSSPAESIRRARLKKSYKSFDIEKLKKRKKADCRFDPCDTRRQGRGEAM
jgi:hypothetical protein